MVCEEDTVPGGVRQGLVIGHILFLVLVNDFSDDLQLFYELFIFETKI